MKKVKFAIVGCGSIGRRHIAVLDANPNVELVAICDINEERVKEQSELYSDLRYFTNYQDMLAAMLDKVDVINIATPHAEHCLMTINALQAGYNVLVEKPMSLTIHECDMMNKEAERSGKKLWVVKQNRFNVPIQLVQDAIKNNRLGKIHMVKCDVLWNRYQGYYDDSPWRGKLKEEGGALFTQVSHFIDLLLWWCGDIESATGIMDTQAHNIDVEDCGSAVLKFKSGTIGSINWTTNVYDKNYEGSITIIGEKGTVKIGGKYLNKLDFWNVEGYPLPEGIEFNDKPNSYGKYQGTSSNHPEVIKAILRDLNTNEEIDALADGFEGAKTVKVIENIYNSINGTQKS
jgi:predicted dehydrogenase